MARMTEILNETIAVIAKLTLKNQARPSVREIAEKVGRTVEGTQCRVNRIRELGYAEPADLMTGVRLTEAGWEAAGCIRCECCGAWRRK